MVDLVVRGGLVVDGTGEPSRVADVAIDRGRIVEIGPGLDVIASETIDATDRIVTPGFVDVHTHYDGQATWDPVLAPSAWHGVTTAVMGNCGVGFAPVVANRHDWLIELMEGVEDIPGTALAVGMSWNWETFPEYLDELERLPRTLDVAAHLTHGALRAYVMGQAGADNEPATAEQVARMADLVRESIEAGAVGFSTNRLPLHTSLHGVPVPGTFADHDELLALTAPMGELGRGLLQAIPAGAMGEDPDAPRREIELFRQISLTTGVTVNFSLAAPHANPAMWVEVLDLVDRANAEGARLVPQVQGRPAGMLAGWDFVHPFRSCPAYDEVAHLPLDERCEALTDPARRAAILDQFDPSAPGAFVFMSSIDTTFPLGDTPDFEPDPSRSVAGIAERAGVAPMAALYDLMCEQPALQVLFAGYKSGNLDAMLDQIRHPATVMGLADGGAHCSILCDASLPSFVLQHWVRDRLRGDRLSLEQGVAALSSEPAELYGLDDRGVLAPGRRGDVNVIDLDGLDMHLPELIGDLPTGARRVVQRADGWTATVCAGEVTFRDGADTGARPGRLIRS